MPTNPTYPGVYIEEIPSGVQTITGVATSVAAFFGRTAKGPLDTAVRCFNNSDFTRAFGGAHKSSDLAQSVRQFFNNGGTDCYVIRLANGAESSSVTLKSLDGQSALVATAKAEGKWGNTVRLEVDYNTTNPDETFNLKVFHEDEGKVAAQETFTGLSMDPKSPRFAPGFVTQSSALINLGPHADMKVGADVWGLIKDETESFNGFSQARRPLTIPGDATTSVKKTLNDLITIDKRYKFNISVNDSVFKTVDLGTWVVPNTLGDIKSELKTAIDTVIKEADPSLEVNCDITLVADIGHLLTISSTTGEKTSVRVRRAGSNDMSEALMLGVEQGGIEPVRNCNFRPVPTVSFISYMDFSVVTAPTLTPINLLAKTAQNLFDELTIGSTDIALTGDYKIETNAGQKWFKNKTGDGTVHNDNDGAREKLRIIAKAINNEVDLEYRAEVWGYYLAIIATSGTINEAPSFIKFKKAGVVVAVPAGLVSAVKANVRQYSLGNAGNGLCSVDGDIGFDGNQPLKSDYIGNEDLQTGFHALDKVDIFNLMILPADEEVELTDIWGAASIYCLKKRAFLLIDAPPKWTDENTGMAAVVRDTTKVDDLRAAVTNKSSAVFYPRLKYKTDILTKLIGPGGAIAGLMARTDAARGVWKAPAGTEADIRGISGLEVKLTDMENGVLNKLAVNCIREFPGSYVCWGSRTMDGHDNNTSADWKYIPVRRLTLFLEESLYRGTKWVVFEPNDEPLWAKIRLNVGAFMKRLFRQGAFQGSTPDKAFYVKCDSETTPQADINLGIVNIEVGFAPLKPAEFVIIKIQQMAGEL